MPRFTDFKNENHHDPDFKVCPRSSPVYSRHEELTEGKPEDIYRRYKPIKENGGGLNKLPAGLFKSGNSHFHSPWIFTEF